MSHVDDINTASGSSSSSSSQTLHTSTRISTTDIVSSSPPLSSFSAQTRPLSTKQKLAVMVCPFAYLAKRSAMSSPGDFTPSDTYPASASYAEQQSLTGKMKAATWATHRQLERSDGVAALMGRSKQSFKLARIDYLRFLMMLLCIYSTMESTILQDQHSPLRDITQELARTDTLLQDIQAHLNELAGQAPSNDANVADLSISEELDANRSNPLHLSLFETVRASMDALQCQTSITLEHILLLSTQQATAVSGYLHALRRLPSDKDEGISFTPLEQADPCSLADGIKIAPTTTTNTTVIAHAYVRYMGDLSGGQHMSRRLIKLFPVDDPDTGFAFYAFPSPVDLKNRLRSTIDEINNLNQEAIAAIVHESVVAFDMHHAIFAALLPEAADGMQAYPDTHPTSHTSIPSLPAAVSMRATAVASA